MIGYVNGFGSISLKWRPIGVSMRFRPLSTRALCALELRVLNRADTSWLPFNFYIYTTESVTRNHTTKLVTKNAESRKAIC